VAACLFADIQLSSAMALAFLTPVQQANAPLPTALRGSTGAMVDTTPGMGLESSSSCSRIAGMMLLGSIGAITAKAMKSRRAAKKTSKFVACTAVRDGWSHCAEYKDELLATVKAITTPGKGILAMDESNGTCGLRLQSIGVENTEENRQKWRQCLLGTKGLGEFCGGAILFTETLYQKTTDGKLMVDLAKENGVIPGIKVDTGLVPLVGGKEGENWCRGLDDLKERTVDFYKAGARFAKWRTTVRVRDHSALAVSEAAHGLARYANICQSSGLVPIIEPEILLDGEHDIDECLETFEETWSAVFKACADFGVMLEAVLLKPSMVTPGAQSGQKADPETIAAYTVGALKRVVPPAVPGIMFLSGGQSEIEATLNLNAMNQSPNPWHISFSYARALQNTTLKTYAGKDENVVAAQAKLIQRAGANSKAQLGKYDPATADEDASAAEGMYVKNYSY
jgi:fructose-bisphosphate aldolase class I